MRVLLNTTTLVKGGALQVAASLIREIAADPGDHEWILALSAKVANELDNTLRHFKTENVRIFAPSPAQNRMARRELKHWADACRPDAVFTVFGPAYVKFNAPHILGVADPWVTHSTRLAFRSIGSRVGQAKTFLRMLYKMFWYRKANSWVVEAENAKRGLGNRLFCPSQRIHVVPNTCGSHYLKAQTQVRRPALTGKIRLLCLSAYYKHKNLEFVPLIARALLAQRPALDFEFVLTLRNDDAHWTRINELARRIGTERQVVNVGPVPTQNGPALYESCHMSILPSLLETFSANYPEAMAMARPIVTSDLDFARAVCGDAAIYFNPEDADDAAGAILRLVDSESLWLQQVSNGERALKRLPTSREKYSDYRSIIENTVRSAEFAVSATAAGLEKPQ